MATCFFASDLHGHCDRYEKLFAKVTEERPAALFLGGDLLPSGIGAVAGFDPGHRDFVGDFLLVRLRAIRDSLGPAYPRIFLILGNDDPRCEEAAILDAAGQGYWEYAHLRRIPFGEGAVYGYSYIPPTPFHLKDWERYDVSRFVDPGCVSPEDGWRTVPVAPHESRYATIRKDLGVLTEGHPAAGEIFLFHSPPYATPLDLADIAGRTIDHVPVDPHVGSIAIRQMIEERQPIVTLHGHVHDAARLTEVWKAEIGRTVCINAAHDGPELSLVRFDPEAPAAATRELV